PQDLAGKRIGEAFSYGTDAGVWIKGILQDHYGVPPKSARYFIGGINNYLPRWDWLPFNPYYQSNAAVEELGFGQTLDEMLETGAIDALCTPVMPQSWLNGSTNIRRLFEDYETVERAYFKQTGIFPIMHTVVIRRDLYRKEPWIAQSLYTAFKESKQRAYEKYRIGDGFMHNYFMVPWFTALRDENRRLMGEDVWPYGLAANRKTVDTFLRYHHEQGLSKRRYEPEEIFATETLGD
ncbi:MAG: 4,5-dihydroxyphthalate decarboxylase, partial [bacterium]